MSRYSDSVQEIPVLLDAEKKRRYYNSLLDPTIERSETDIYVVTVIGDRLDLLAWKYYSDVTLWWIIAAANPELRKDSLYLEPGIQLRIPRAYVDILSNYYKQNATR